MELEKKKTEILSEEQLYQKVAAILIGSEFYLDLNLNERYHLLRYILADSCLSVAEEKSPRSRRQEIDH
jgi:hypothetical protein